MHHVHCFHPCIIRSPKHKNHLYICMRTPTHTDTRAHTRAWQCIQTVRHVGSDVAGNWYLALLSFTMFMFAIPACIIHSQHQRQHKNHLYICTRARARRARARAAARACPCAHIQTTATSAVVLWLENSSWSFCPAASAPSLSLFPTSASAQNDLL